MDLIQTWHDNRHYCTLHFARLTDFDLRSQEWKKGKLHTLIISQSFQLILSVIWCTIETCWFDEPHTELSLRTKWHVTWHLHVISARCVARDLHTVAPRPLEYTCWRQFAALWGDCKKSRTAPLNAIIIIIIILILSWAFNIQGKNPYLYDLVF